jgi:hypothetical protein
LHGRIVKALGDTRAVGLIGDVLTDLRHVVLRIRGSNADEALDPRCGVRERYPVRGRRQTADHKPTWWDVQPEGC